MYKIGQFVEQLKHDCSVHGFLRDVPCPNVYGVCLYPCPVYLSSSAAAADAVSFLYDRVYPFVIDSTWYVCPKYLFLSQIFWLHLRLFDHMFVFVETTRFPVYHFFAIAVSRHIFHRRHLYDLRHFLMACHSRASQVWEESVINCPKTVLMVALSATMSNVGEIKDWVQHTHGPSSLVVSDFRPVPLS